MICVLVPISGSLGVASNAVQDFQFSSSAIRESEAGYRPPWTARPDYVELENELAFQVEESNDWIQVDLLFSHYVTAVKVVRSDGDVSSFTMLYSNTQQVLLDSNEWQTHPQASLPVITHFLLSNCLISLYS